MKELLITLLFSAIALGFIFEFASLLTYGWWTKRKVLLDNRALNRYDSDILSTLFEPYISKNPFPLLSSKYHISGIGLVPRWSKFHKEIEAKFKELRSEL